MAALEGKPRTFWQSLEWAAETLSTTGYGADSALAPSGHGAAGGGGAVPRRLPGLPDLSDLSDPLPGRALRDPAAAGGGERPRGARGRSTATARRSRPCSRSWPEPACRRWSWSTDESVARRLFERGVRIVHREPGRGRRCRRPGWRRRGRSSPTAPTTRTPPSASRPASSASAAPILALVEDPFHRRPMMLAGATAVFTPRHILGAALAARASARINPRVGGIQQLGRNLEVAELRVSPESPLAGHTLDETAIGTRTGAKVVGQWIGGELVVPDGSGLRLEPDGILVVVGSPESVDRLQRPRGGRGHPAARGAVRGGRRRRGGAQGGRAAARGGGGGQLIDRHAGPGGRPGGQRARRPAARGGGRQATPRR